MITAITIRELLTKRPFPPFRLVISRNETFEILRPEMAWLTQNDVIIGTGETRRGVPSEARIRSLLQVMNIEPISPSTDIAK